MKLKNLLKATTLISLTAVSGASAQDATTTQSTAVNRNVTVSGNVETVTLSEPNYDDGVFLGGGTYVDTVASSSTATSLNTSGISATSVGNSMGQTSITGLTVTVDGAADLNNGLNVDGLSTLDDTTIVGTTSITGTISINTTGINATTIGNSSAASDVTLVGGSSRVVLEDRTTSINTLGGAANTVIGGNLNETSILSTSIIVGNHNIASNVAVGTGTAANTISIGNGVIGTEITTTTFNTLMKMKADSISNTVTASGGVSAGSVVANNGSARWVADANGKLTEVTASDTTSGTTAAMVVTNSAGNTHGLVVQEAKTTISGGTNSSSMSLSDNGATFSDSATGQPIQVHGVADGTADFDAVNVRQLYSGLAAVLAATPEINLAPGKSGMGIGLGGYGGFEAIGVGFGHMYDNGAVVKVSVSKAAHSEVAVRAGVSWNW